MVACDRDHLLIGTGIRSWAEFYREGECMMMMIDRKCVIGAAVAALLLSTAVATAQDTDPGMEMEPVPLPGAPAPDMPPEPLDAERQLLYDTAVRDDMADLADAEAALSDAEDALSEAMDEGADPEVIAGLEADRDAAQAEVDREMAEADALRTALEGMTDDQVTATNRSLRDTNAKGATLDLDAATLMEIADRDLDGRGIQALTKGLEEEAKFEGLADRFDARYEETGREKFATQRDRMNARAERQRDKFEAKVDRFDGTADEARREARDEARSDARDSARQNARNEARRVARDEARDENRGRGRGRQ